MKQLCLFLTAAAAFLTAAAQPHEPFLGRWDVTVTTATATYPDWLNVELKDGHLSGTIQPRSGSAFAVDDLKKDGPNHLVIKAKQATWDLTLNGDQFTGSIKQGDAAQGQLAGVRAPALKRPMPKEGPFGLGANGSSEQPLGREERRTGERGSRFEPQDDA
jgi:hypothetical protein